MMPTQMVRQTTFTTGEVDQTAWKRTEVDEYLSAAQSLKNMEVTTLGGAKKRKGTQKDIDATPYANDYSRMYEFIDKNQNHYLVMSGHNNFYIFDTPTESVQVVTRRRKLVITLRNTLVVAHEEGLKFIQAVPTPYLTTDLNQLDYTQANDSIVFTHGDYPPGRIYISSYATNPPTFSFQYLTITPYPAWDFNTVNYSGFSAVFTNPTPQTFRLVLSGSADTQIITTAWIGGQVVGSGASIDSPLGYGIITNVTHPSGTSVQIDGDVYVQFASPANMPLKGSLYSIRQPAWSATLGYPSKVLFFQNRLWFANTKTLPVSLFGSKINAPINFDVGTGRDTDAIVYSIGQTDCGAIRWLNGGKNLEIYADNYEFSCPQDLESALTPSTFSIRQQSSYGSSKILKPITYINDSYFANRSGRALLNFHFNGVGLTYVATNISAASFHLVKNPSNRALIRGSDDSQDNFVYYLNPDDATLTAFQFAQEYKLAALTPVEFQTDDEGNPTVEIVDIVTIANTVYLLKYFNLTGYYAIEHFTADLKIDSYRQAEMASSGLVTGLDDLNGYTVQVVYQNQDFGEYTVGNSHDPDDPWDPGTIVVDNPQEIADTVFIGLLYENELVPMYIFGGRLASPLFKNITRIYVDYYNSLDFNINDKLVNYQNFREISEGLPLTPKTDTAIVDITDGWERFSTFRISQSSPFDLQILSIAYQVETTMI